MNLPERFMFYHRTNKKQIYTAINTKVGRYHITWYDSVDKRQGNASYPVENVPGFIKSGDWILIDFKDNESALHLLKEDEYATSP